MSYSSRENSRRSSSDGNLGGFRVYVGDLGSRIGRTDLEREFGQYGPITDVWMGRKREVTSPSYAFVVYRYPEDAEEAVRDRNGRKLCGRKVRVEHAKPINSNPRRFRGGWVNRGRGGDRGDYRGNQQSRFRERYNNNRRSRSQSPARNSRGQQSPSSNRNDDFDSSSPKKYAKRSASDSPDNKSKKKFKRDVSTTPSPPRPKDNTDSDSSSSPPPKKSTKKQKRGHSPSQSPQRHDERPYQKFQEVPRKSAQNKKKTNYADTSSSED
ncbi:serine/arginine-rich splicing factor 3 [Biomphalaria pfeifferi]|uniref:Serine/arginine-rich splicing factor 3 n=1 Tax=Biomphalaria pfeifferi TaxID=112525 RepID=A0AAD8FBB0_BIOPF|nr:serine/arginine-rich splicing factor 3 [Biomphalaria pfeifferi]